MGPVRLEAERREWRNKVQSYAEIVWIIINDLLEVLLVVRVMLYVGSDGKMATPTLAVAWRS